MFPPPLGGESQKKVAQIGKFISGKVFLWLITYEVIYVFLIEGTETCFLIPLWGKGKQKVSQNKKVI